MDTQQNAAKIGRTVVKKVNKITAKIKIEEHQTWSIQGATSTVGKPGDGFIPTEKLSHKVY